MARIVVPTAEALLDKKLPVKGQPHAYVQLIDYTGGDLRVAQAAWVNETNKRGKNDAASQRRVIHQMMGEFPPHWSPFEQVALVFQIQLTIREMRQHGRHRATKTNEFSQRYFDVPEEFHEFAPEAFRTQSKSSHQGRSDMVVPMAEILIEKQKDYMREGFELYREMLAAGTAKEIARSHLPLATYTRIIWQIDLRNLFNYVQLRLDSHAQEEIRNLAAPIYQCAKAVAPICCAEFEENILYGKHLSRTEWTEVQAKLVRLEKLERFVGLSEEDSPKLADPIFGGVST